MSAAADTVLIRYWAAARDAAGVEEEHLIAGTVDELLAEVVRRHGEPLARLLAASSLLLDGQAVGHLDPTAIPLTPGSTVEVLPPFAGG
jgi:sulfur-carrier protein